MIKNKKERKTMSNNYDIEIKMDYFLSGDDYHSSLEGLKKFKEIVQMHIERWEYHVSSEETFNESWEEMYGE
jgi:glucosamine 6-phosphate synthetase-like amidotransferase/phosphosugar isomerase protein